MQTLTLIRPDDMHVHVRDGEDLKAVVPFTAKQMGRAVIMPNLKPPVTRVEDALRYQEKIMQACPPNASFTPLMTLYLTDATTPDLVKEAKKAGILAFKLYPAGATTHSDAGVTDVFRLLPVLECMAEEGMPLLMHGEVTDPAVDIFDREKIFIDRVLIPLLQGIPQLKVVFEHITTAEAAQWVMTSEYHIAATVTPQHLLLNRNHMLVGGIRPHYYCLPILKRASHQQALIEAVTGEYAHKFFLGTDSAPHTQHAKENACGCAGVFSAHAAIELYAEVFDQANALDKLQAFSSENGAKFYGLELNTDTITLAKKTQEIPAYYEYGEYRLVPFRAQESISWSIVS